MTEYGIYAAASHATDGQSRAWTSARIDFLKRMRRHGRSYRWIAKALGVSRTDCVAQAEAVGLLLRSQFAPAAPPDEPQPCGSPGEILGDGVCHWVAGEPDSGCWRMCGHPSAHGSAWCGHHFARVMRPRAAIERLAIGQQEGGRA